jgi:hypothetical protein
MFEIQIIQMIFTESISVISRNSDSKFSILLRIPAVYRIRNGGKGTELQAKERSAALTY